MALAKNLKNNNFPIQKSNVGKFFGTHKKKFIIGLIVISVLMGAYGIYNLAHLAPKTEDKQDVVYETGDQPLPEKITIYIDAEGGLNLREEPNTVSKIVKIIPNGTKLTAEEIQGEWYKVIYDGKTGWVNEKYIKRYTDEDSTTPATDGWQKYQNSEFSYAVSYPVDWVKVDYGANQASGLVGYVGFGMQLSDEIDPNVTPPIVIKVTKDTKEVVDTNYKKKTNSVASNVTISGIKGIKYVYTASSGVQMTAMVIASGGNTYILEESGGYADELTTMSGSFRLN